MSTLSTFLLACTVICICCPLFCPIEAILGGSSVPNPGCVARISIRNRKNAFGAVGAYIEAIKHGRIHGLIVSVCSGLANLPRSQLEVVAGVTDRLDNRKGCIRNVSSVIRHPEWNENYAENYNICIFVLGERMNTKKCIVDTVNRLPNQPVKIYGWGANSPQNMGVQLRKLHMAETTLAHPNGCRAVYGYHNLTVPVPWNDRDYYCTRTAESGQCSNDFGALCVIKSNTLVGVTTFGGYCGYAHNLMGVVIRGSDIVMFLKQNGYSGADKKNLKEKSKQSQKKTIKNSKIQCPISELFNNWLCQLCKDYRQNHDCN